MAREVNSLACSTQLFILPVSPVSVASLQSRIDQRSHAPVYAHTYTSTHSHACHMHMHRHTSTDTCTHPHACHMHMHTHTSTSHLHMITCMPHAHAHIHMGCAVRLACGEHTSWFYNTVANKLSASKLNSKVRRPRSVSNASPR